MNKFCECKNSVILHCNPNHSFDADHDEVSKIAISFFDKDKMTFERRMKELGLDKNFK